MAPFSGAKGTEEKVNIGFYVISTTVIKRLTTYGRIEEGEKRSEGDTIFDGHGRVGR